MVGLLSQNALLHRLNINKLAVSGVEHYFISPGVVQTSGFQI